jgi:hypothetical protein
MRLYAEIVAEARGKVEIDLARLMQQKGTEQAYREVLQLVTSPQASAKADGHIVRYFQIVWLFNHYRERGGLSRKVVDDLTTMAEYSLRLLGVKPYSSHLSYLYRSLYEARGRLLGIEQHPWLAAWSHYLADALDGSVGSADTSSANFTTQLQLAQYHFALGAIGESLESYQRAEAAAASDEEIGKARLGMIRCLRIFGECESASNLAAGITEHAVISDDLRAKLMWEQVFAEAQRSNDCAGIVKTIQAVRRRQTVSNARYLVFATLWCYASRQRSAIADLPGISWIKRTPSLKDGVDEEADELLGFYQTLEACYAPEGAVFDKLKMLGDALDATRERHGSEELGVFLAAVVRWLIRTKQKHFAAMAMNEYHQISLALTRGRSAYLFDLLADIGDKLGSTGDTTRDGNESRDLKAGMERSLLYVEMCSKLFLTTLATKTGKWLGRKDSESVQSELLVNLSRYLVQYAGGAMKGPIHKMAQIVMNFSILPPEAEENFKSVLWSKKVISFKAMRSILEEEIGRSLEDVFAEFDIDPIGIGSVAQVYRARLKSGDEVAVKIRYPDLDKVAKQDLAMISRMFVAAKWLFPSQDFKAIKALMVEHIEKEIDFRHEASIYQELQNAARTDHRWDIPKTYLDLSSKRVLTTEYVAGRNFYHFLESADYEARLRAALAISQFAYHLLDKHGLVWLDPHPANMLFDRDRIVFIDFGFLMRVSETYVDTYKRIYHSDLGSGPARIDAQYALLVEMGHIKPSPGVAEHDVKECLMAMADLVDWERCSDPAVQLRYNELFFKKRVNKVMGTPDPRYFCGHLAHLQIAKMLSRLNVRRPEGWTKALLTAS